MKKLLISLFYVAIIFALIITASLVPVAAGSSQTIIDVPFKAQVPPGEWGKTNNCGQTSSLMVFRGYEETTPTAQDIKDIDDWLYRKYGDPTNDYNGSESGTTKLETLAREYAGFADS